mmetsp:Transcript_82569/g.130557  ORF Transcript_82569/g.130557 Transcript_82569/m.130557 type:complete len:225 (+) Transcript_82569:621-1295(+)
MLLASPRSLRPAEAAGPSPRRLKMLKLRQLRQYQLRWQLLQLLQLFQLHRSFDFDQCVLVLLCPRLGPIAAPNAPKLRSEDLQRPCAASLLLLEQHLQLSQSMALLLQQQELSHLQPAQLLSLSPHIPPHSHGHPPPLPAPPARSWHPRFFPDKRSSIHRWPWACQPCEGLLPHRPWGHWRSRRLPETGTLQCWWEDPAESAATEPPQMQQSALQLDCALSGVV